MAFQDFFSVVAFFIFLRETLEASVIIAVLLQCMNRTAPRLKRFGEARSQAAVRALSVQWRARRACAMHAARMQCWQPRSRLLRRRRAALLLPTVWWGAAVGIGLSIVFGGIFAALFYLAQTRLFQVRAACVLLAARAQAARQAAAAQAVCSSSESRSGGAGGDAGRRARQHAAVQPGCSRCPPARPPAATGKHTCAHHHITSHAMPPPLPPPGHRQAHLPGLHQLPRVHPDHVPGLCHDALWQR